jgi:nucleolar protein 15
LKEASNSASAGLKTDSSLSKKNKPIQKKVEAKAEGKQIKDKDDGSEVDEDEDSDDEVDDQTAALLKGFESDGDEEDDKIEEGYKDGLAIPTIEDNKELSKKKQAKLKRAAAFPGQGKPGVVYVGRIPHGFYENEMRAYFKQFGNILKLRLSRNKKTGASRHYAFIQFESATVADIVAKTMDNYLMFGHLLKVKFIPDEQVPADVFKGANKRFKKVPWNKMEGRKLEQGASETVWGERAGREQKRRDQKAKKLKAIGYEFDAPRIKSAENLSKKKDAIELTGDEGEIKAIEAAPVAKESSEHNKKKKKKSKAAKGAKGEVGVEEPSKPEKQEEKSTDAKTSKESVAALVPETAEKSTKKEKKDKKKKKDVATSELNGNEEVKPVEAAPTAESSSKPKKDKKKKKSKVVDE